MPMPQPMITKIGQKETPVEGLPPVADRPDRDQQCVDGEVDDQVDPEVVLGLEPLHGQLAPGLDVVLHAATPM